MAKDVDNTKPRYIPPGACSWCGHKPHDSACASTIRTKAADRAACPCGKRVA